jgi:glycosyltransferase involved in cell wall biosynthesis
MSCGVRDGWLDSYRKLIKKGREMNKKTIAIVINTSWNIFNFRMGLIKALQENGYRIIAIAPRDEYSQRIEEMDIPYYDIFINNKGTNPIEDAKLVFSFYSLYKKLSPDIILQYTIKPNIYGSMAAGMLGIPVISNISGLGTVFLNNNLSSKIARLLYKVALKTPKKIFFQNSHDKILFIESKLVDASKAKILPGSGINTEKFKPVNREREDNEGIKFLFIARLLKDKGLIEYVEAAKKIIDQRQKGIQKEKKPKFFILGAYYPGNPTAITENEMKRWEKEGLVHYLGTSDDVKSVIENHDCIVLPSYREGLSRVLLEGASMAKPIITSDVPGCREVVDDGINGYLCKVQDTNSLAEQMKKIIALSTKERKLMGQKGREKVIKEFHKKIVIYKYLKAIKRILKEKASSLN